MYEKIPGSIDFQRFRGLFVCRCCAAVWWRQQNNDQISVIDPNGVHAVPRNPKGKVFRSAVQICQGVALYILLCVQREASGDPAQNGNSVLRLKVQGYGIGGKLFFANSHQINRSNIKRVRKFCYCGHL